MAPNWHCRSQPPPDHCVDRGSRRRGGGPHPVFGRQWFSGSRRRRYAARLCGRTLCIGSAPRKPLTQAAEQYRSTVLTAFQNVADTLHALQQDADALQAAAAAKNAASVTLDLSRKQYQSGYVSYLALLSAEQAYQQALINLVQAQANRYADTAALFQALGGGSWNRPDVPKS